MYIGIDIGGTNARVAASSTCSNITNLTKKEFTLTHSFEQDFSHIIQIITELGQGKVEAIGMGVPGDLNTEKTIFVSPSKNLDEWSYKPIHTLLTEAFHCPVILENDAVVAATAEAYFGKGKDKDFAYIIWGTGIGGAKVHWQKKRADIVKLDWYQYFQTWEHDCGGNEIEKHLGISADALTEEQWQDIIKNFSHQLLKFCQQTHSSLIFFAGGIAVRQLDRVRNYLRPLSPESALPEIQLSALGEDTGLYGALRLLQ